MTARQPGNRTQGATVAHAAAAAREVLVNHETMLKNGKRLRESRFWNFVIDNAAVGLFDGYKQTLYGLVSILQWKIHGMYICNSCKVL